MLAAHLTKQTAAAAASSLFTPVELDKQSEVHRVVVVAIHIPSGCRVELSCDRIGVLLENPLSVPWFVSPIVNAIK